MLTKATKIKLSLLSAIVMTEDCEFKRILRKHNMNAGAEINIDIKSESVKKPLFITKFKPNIAFGVLAIFLCLFIVVKLSVSLIPERSSVFAYIDVDINPSVSFSIDKNAKVLSVDSLNDDAIKLINEADYKGKNITDAIILFTQKAKTMEFDSSFVLISGAVDQLNKDSAQNEDMLQDVLLSIINDDKMKDFEILSQAVKVSPEMKAEAKENGITLARQAAYIHANRNGNSISLEQIKESETSYIFTILGSEGLPEDDSSIITEVIDSSDEVSGNKAPTAESTPSPEATPSPSPESTPSPTPTPTPTSTPKPTPTNTPTPSPKPKSTPTPAPSTVRKATVTAKATDSGIKLTWNKTDSYGFVYYKVVMSKNNSSPSYPDDGYIIYISDVNTTSYMVKPYAQYNGGDFGGKVKPGETYYFSITAVYDDAKVKGNAVKKTMPGEIEFSPEPTNQTLNLSSSIEDGKLYISWSPLSKDGFNYYKVVVSKNNPNPIYPDDGYLYAISDINKTRFPLNPEHEYNRGDFGGKMVSGEKYFIGITAVYNDKKILSNVLYLTCP
ncbi:MAG: anti-sigma factor domain-containing protein [Clostridiaceae bacterium]|nr:anti-sigma factor domain-containing protein [Clostridiaceae bacterium]